MTISARELLLREYQEVNAHLRANTTQFVNWFSFFLTSSFVMATIFLITNQYQPGLRGFALEYGLPIVFLLLHILAFVGIVTFRRYITAAHGKIDEIIRLLGDTGGSPIPVRFSQWMTHLMAAGFMISYFAWFSLLFVR